MRLNQKDYIQIHNRYGYVIEILGASNGALYLKDLCRYVHKSYAQTCRDIIELEKTKVIKVDIVNNAKIVALTRKAWNNYFSKDNAITSRQHETLLKNSIRAYLYKYYDRNIHQQIQKYLYNNFYDLNTISEHYKEKNKHIFDIFKKDNIQFYFKEKNQYKVVITTYKVDYESVKEIKEILEKIYDLFYMLDLNNNKFKCEVTVLTYSKVSEKNKKYLINEILRHRTQVDYVNNRRKFRNLFCKHFRKKIKFKTVI